MTTWAVIHRLRAGKASRNVARLVITGVPDGATQKALRGVLEEAGYGARFSAGGVAFANHSINREDRWPELSNGRAEEVTWDAIAGAKASRRITLDLEPATYAVIRLAAEGRGLSINSWCRMALLAATVAQA